MVGAALHGMPSVRPTVTLYPNRLQSLSASIPDVFVTINPFREPDADKIIVNRVLVHPVVGTGTEAALQKLDADGNKVDFPFFSTFEDGNVALGWLRVSRRELDEQKSTPHQPKYAHQSDQLLAPGEVVPVQTLLVDR